MNFIESSPRPYSIERARCKSCAPVIPPPIRKLSHAPSLPVQMQEGVVVNGGVSFILVFFFAVVGFHNGQLCVVLRLAKAIVLDVCKYVARQASSGRARRQVQAYGPLNLNLPSARTKLAGIFDGFLVCPKILG